MNGVPVFSCEVKKFNKECESVHRFFIPEEGMGIHLDEAVKEGYEPQVILRREDGWVVSCSSDKIEETFKLYPESWVVILLKEGV